MDHKHEKGTIIIILQEVVFVIDVQDALNYGKTVNVRRGVRGLCDSLCRARPGITTLEKVRNRYLMKKVYMELV